MFYIQLNRIAEKVCLGEVAGRIDGDVKVNCFSFLQLRVVIDHGTNDVSVASFVLDIGNTDGACKQGNGESLLRRTDLVCTETICS